ncbi:MAG: hypothetical protein HEQ10_06880 [Dolichospermum sp. DEX182a]|nr:hypothetical protein [Dolichospermum sp. DEX182a]
MQGEIIFLITNYQSPITNHQLPITNYQLPIPCGVAIFLPENDEKRKSPI